jgi:hypothetical protein
MPRSVTAPEAAAFFLLVIVALVAIGALFARLLAGKRAEKR